MLRRNPQTGVWERKEGDGWVPAHNAEGGVTELDIALDDVFSDTAPANAAGGSEGSVSGGVGAPSATATASPPDAPRQAVAAAGGQGQASAAQDALVVGPNGADRGPDSGQPGDLDGSAAVLDAGTGDDWAIPGLVSTEGGRSVAGQKGLRKRLQERAKGKRAQGSAAPERKSQKVEVGPRSARPSGPAVRDGTEARQARKKSTGSPDGKAARYVTKPAPELIGKRPKWVQDLFEAHFRSEITLAMRRAPSGDMRSDGSFPNRMKISRQDYAIGWLTLFDKLREDVSILRLKDGQG